MRISHFSFDFCQWKAEQITFGKAQTLCEWLNNWHQLCFSWEQIGHTGYITVWQENPFLDNFTHLTFYSIFLLKFLRWNHYAHIFLLIHTHSLFHAIGRLLRNKEKPKQWLSSFLAKARKNRWRNTFLVFCSCQRRRKRNLCACNPNQWFLVLLLLAVLRYHHVHILRCSPRHICLCKREDWMMDQFWQYWMHNKYLQWLALQQLQPWQIKNAGILLAFTEITLEFF